MNLRELMSQAYTIAFDKGWHDDPRSLVEEIALMHSELSEALEELRKGRLPFEMYNSEGGKPEGVAVELADCIIRIADTCQARGIPLEEALRVKLEFNKSRPYKHGKVL